MGNYFLKADRILMDCNECKKRKLCSLYMVYVPIKNMEAFHSNIKEETFFCSDKCMKRWEWKMDRLYVANNLGA